MDHAAEGIARLPTAFRETNSEDVVTAITSSHQSLEDALEAMPAAMSVDDSEGAQLTGIGKVVVEPRNGADDTTYRPRVRARILVNKSGGRTEDVIAVVDALLVDQPAVSAYMREEYPAAFRMVITGADVDYADVIARFIGEAKGSGIAARTSYANAAAASTFTLDGTPAQGLDGGIMMDGIVT